VKFSHIPVLLEECLEGLDIKPGGTYIDGTAGGGGHSEGIAKRLSANGSLLSIDRDPDAVSAASERLSAYTAKVVRGNYSDIAQIARENGIEYADGILLDLGVSSHQLDISERGFSYHAENAPLDMRMSKEGKTAGALINEYSYQELRRVLYEYGEEKFAPKIAAEIIKRREIKPIETTGELAEIIKNSVPAKFKRAHNPCKKTFQALRIAVNSELEHLSSCLDNAFELLRPGGRLCVITFHSLEDRMVKHRFAGFCQGCICPPKCPVCICGNTPKAKRISKKPIIPAESEITRNNRARSAKLRIIEKI